MTVVYNFRSPWGVRDWILSCRGENERVRKRQWIKVTSAPAAAPGGDGEDKYFLTAWKVFICLYLSPRRPHISGRFGLDGAPSSHSNGETEPNQTRTKIYSPLSALFWKLMTLFSKSEPWNLISVCSWHRSSAKIIKPKTGCLCCRDNLCKGHTRIIYAFEKGWVGVGGENKSYFTAQISQLLV